MAVWVPKGSGKKCCECHKKIKRSDNWIYNGRYWHDRCYEKEHLRRIRKYYGKNKTDKATGPRH